MPYTVLNFYKAAEGGPVKKDILDALKHAKIPAIGSTSMYVGQTAVIIKTHNKRLIKRAERIVYGR